MGRPIDDAEARRCFGCHTTASTTAAGFAASRAIPGVTCEACHGPGRAHVNAMERGADRTRAAGTILNPRRLDASDSVDLCGACHATFWDVQLAGERGIAALRSQPFRLQSSRCWSGDRRLACVACHDPHSPLVREAEFYDSRCLACHQSGSATATDANAALVSGGDGPMRHVPHAQIRRPRDALLVHRPSDPHPGSALTRRFADKSAPTILRPHSPSPVLRNPGASCGAPRPNSPP